jgi:hypothetical protein
MAHVAFCAAARESPLALQKTVKIWRYAAQTTLFEVFSA